MRRVSASCSHGRALLRVWQTAHARHSRGTRRISGSSVGHRTVVVSHQRQFHVGTDGCDSKSKRACNTMRDCPAQQHNPQRAPGF